MGILDNLENSWELEVPEPPQYESTPMVETDAMGREKFWEDLGRPENDGLALQMFKEQCCDQCSCSSK
jgi:hypothetical protein